MCSSADECANDLREQFLLINESLAQAKENVGALVSDAARLATAGTEGQLNVRADSAKHAGEYRRIIEGINATLDAVTGPLGMAASYVDQIAKGIIPPKITENYAGDFNTLKDNLNACIDGLGGLIEANQVLQLMAVNDCTVQVNGSYQGIFAEVASATNAAQARVKNVIRLCRDVAAGDYRTDLADMKKVGRRSENDTLVPAFIQMMEAIDGLAVDAEMLSRSAVAGKLSARADASRHRGEYRKVLEGVNGTLDALTAPLNVAANYVDRIAKGDIPPEDYRQLQRRLQRHQEQSERLHRWPWRACGSKRRFDENGGQRLHQDRGGKLLGRLCGGGASRE